MKNVEDEMFAAQVPKSMYLFEISAAFSLIATAVYFKFYNNIRS